MTIDALIEMGRRGSPVYERELAMGPGVARMGDVFRALGNGRVDPAAL